MADDALTIEEEDDKELPANKPGSSKRFLDDIAQAEKAFDSWQTKSDNVDKLYADLSRQSDSARDREFAMFWANVQVLAPSTYARPPVPVVVPRFKDRRAVPQAASELLERSTIVAFEMEDIDQVMRLVRDDLAIVSRGTPWVRYETEKRGGYGERVCIEHLDRKDFLHEPARKWKEVGWVARRGWLSKTEMRKRFRKTSGDAYKDAEYTVQKEDRDNGAADNRAKAGVWEIWHKDLNKVIWVAPSCDVVLDEGEPHLKLEGFFPCPRPAYGTLQRRSLIPVPDMVFYKDQLEEINELTARIAALSEAVKVRGFYPSGAGEIGDAIEAAIKSVTNNQVMVPISNWAAFGNGAAKDMIVWLPIDIIVGTIVSLVELRKQLIDDVYQITGLSDVMRGSTDPNETLGAQELKSQYGSIRIRDKQAELVRVARDLARLTAEIMAENFSPKTLLAMAQMELPKDAEIKAQEKQIIEQAKQQVQQMIMQARQQQMQAAQQPPQPGQSPQGQPGPEQPQQDPQAAVEGMISEMEQKVLAQIEKLKQQPTVEQVMSLLREERLRPFVLDIETDSTIQPDENAEKQLRAEFLTALGGTMQQLAPLIATEPAAAPFAGEVLKFALAPYRAGRELDAAVDELVDQMKAKSGQPQPNPEAEAAKAELEGKFELEKMKIEAANKGKESEMQARMAEIQAEAQRDQQKHQQEMQKGQLEIRKLEMQIEALREKARADAQTAQIDAAATQQKAQIETQSAQQQADIAAKSADQQNQIKAEQASQQAEQADRSFEQKSALTAQQARAKAMGPAK